MGLPKQSVSGFALLELVISMGVLAVLLYAIASLVVASYDLVGYSRTRISARHLANEKMELIRNLPYAAVAVQGGIPAGTLPQLENVERNGGTYVVRTNVVYVDDLADGLAPQDTLPTDYKRVRIDVSWTGVFASNSTITLVTDVTPKGVETTTGGGTLSILVFNANAQPVADASVHITNSLVSPAVDLTVNSDDAGRVLLPGAPVCAECYAITVTKSGYSSDQTYTTTQVAHPDKPLATIVQGSITVSSFAIDQVSSIQVKSTLGRDSNYATLTNQFFLLTSNKRIGTNVTEDPVYKYNQTLQTGGNGSMTINNLEWGSYTLTLPAATWDLAGTNPLSPFVVLPNTSQTVTFASVAHQTKTLLLRAIDASGSAMPAVSVHLSNGVGYSTILLTGTATVADYGQAFFSPLTSGVYSIEASKSGYLTDSFQATISGNLQDTAVMNLP